jgi:DNA-binding XRE family transcriptional regulator
MAKKSDTMKLKRDYARMLYLKDNLTQQEIAERVGTSQQTICKWKADDNWDSLKANFVISRQETLSRTYAQINQVFSQLESLSESGELIIRTINPREADTLSKLAATAKALETELSISIYIDVFIKFGNWLREADFATSKKMVELQDSFIKEQLRNA